MIFIRKLLNFLKIWVVMNNYALQGITFCTITLYHVYITNNFFLYDSNSIFISFSLKVHSIHFRRTITERNHWHVKTSRFEILYILFLKPYNNVIVWLFIYNLFSSARKNKTGSFFFFWLIFYKRPPTYKQYYTIILVFHLYVWTVYTTGMIIVYAHNIARMIELRLWFDDF